MRPVFWPDWQRLGSALVLGLCLAAFAALGVQAQDQVVLDRITDLVTRGEALIEQGRDADGIALVNQAKDMVDAGQGKGSAIYFLPNLAIARADFRKNNYVEVERFAGWVAAAMDDGLFADHPFRVEALSLLGVALAEQSRPDEAASILRAAMRGRGKLPDRLPYYDRTLMYLAVMTSQIKSADAAGFRARALAEIVPGQNVAVREYAFLLYTDLLKRRQAGEAGGDLLPDGRALIAIVDGSKDVSARDQSFYKGFFAVVLSDAGEFAEAEVLLRERGAFLLADSPKGRNLLSNGQRLAAVLVLQNKLDAAVVVLKQSIAHFHATGSDAFSWLSGLQRELGNIATKKDDAPLAQSHYRAAYASLRKVRSATDDRVQKLRKKIDIQDLGFAGFKFAAELEPGAGAEFHLTENGEAVLRLFLAGEYQTAEAQLIEVMNNGGRGRSEYYLNTALYAALLGQREKAIKRLARVKTAPQGLVPASSVYPDIIRVVALIWGTSDRSADADKALARLIKRTGLDPTETDLIRALQVYRNIEKDRSGETVLLLRNWLAAHDFDRKQTLWDVFAALLVVETAFFELETKEADQLHARLIARMPMLAELPLAADYLELQRLMNGVGIASGDEGWLALGGVSKRLRGHVPAGHILQTTSRFAVALGFIDRLQFDAALKTMLDTAAAYRLHPYHRPDVLAFLLAQQAGILRQKGDWQLAVSVASQAYETLEIKTARSDFAVGVIETYAVALWNFDEYEKAAAILEPYVQGSDFFDGLSAQLKVKLLVVYSQVLIDLERFQQARDVLELAFDVLPYKGFKSGYAELNIFYQIAINEYRAGNLQAAFTAVHNSNVLMRQVRVAAISQTTGQIESSEIDLQRVMAEAELGWALSQSLDK